MSETGDGVKDGVEIVFSPILIWHPRKRNSGAVNHTSPLPLIGKDKEVGGAHKARQILRTRVHMPIKTTDLTNALPPESPESTQERKVCTCTPVHVSQQHKVVS